MASTPVSATRVRTSLERPRCHGCQERDDVIRTLQSRVQELQRFLQDTRQQLRVEQERSGRNSSNSSIPPSQDPLDAPRTKSSRKRSGRKAGAQPGHAPTNPGFIPEEDLTQPPVACIPNTCERCQSTLSGTDPDPLRHQVIELPAIHPDIFEYRCHSLTCAHCGHATRGQLSTGVTSGQYGPRLQAFVALCTSAYHLSKRQVEHLLTTTFNIPIALGSICNIEKRVCAAVAEPVAEARRFVQRAEVVNADESSWPEQPHKGWLWLGVAGSVAAFSARRHRDRASAEDLLGPDFAGVLISDRLSSYSWVRYRQFCWAHLRRDWQAMIDRGGKSRQVGQCLKELTRQMVDFWHGVRNGTLPYSLFQLHMISIRMQVGACLREGAACRHPRTAGTCATILNHESCLWRFVDQPGIEPTNNLAERTLRQAVLWRKKCSGTRSAAGSRFVESLLTVVATCRLQNRDVLEYLTEACVAHARGEPRPSLLPTPPPTPP